MLGMENMDFEGWGLVNDRAGVPDALYHKHLAWKKGIKSKEIKEGKAKGQEDEEERPVRDQEGGAKVLKESCGNRPSAVPTQQQI